MSPQSVVVYSDAAPASATIQIRILAPLGAEGIDVVCADSFRGEPDRLAKVVEQAAAVIVHRGIKKRCKLYQTLLVQARRHRVPFLYDVDDLLIDVHESHPDRAFYQSRKLHALKPLLDADLAVASTQELAGALTPFQNTLVLPNRLPMKLWSSDSTPSKSNAHVRGPRLAPSAHQFSPPLTIGYVGSRTHAPDLEMVEDAIISVLDRHRSAVRFLSVGVPLSPKLRSHEQARMVMPSKSVQHDYSQFASFARTLSFDVGIAPLVDTPFNRCKSDVKFQEYSALGVPGVFSDLPPYRHVRHGENGLLATTTSQWADCLNQLLDSTDLRRSMSARAGESLRSAGSSRDERTWTQLIEQARSMNRAGAAGAQTSLSSIVDDLFEYETDLQQQLKWTIRYQVKNYYDRLRRKLAA
jgi:glycosyltransferase involved in cell wall biosynthesis